MDSDCHSFDQATSAPTDSFLADSLNGTSVEEITSLTAANPPAPEGEDLDSYNLIEPPPLEWRSDSSSEAADEMEESTLPVSVDSLEKTNLDASVLLPLDVTNRPALPDTIQHHLVENITKAVHSIQVDLGDECQEIKEEKVAGGKLEGIVDQDKILKDIERINEDVEHNNRISSDEDHSRIQTLLSQLHLMEEEPHPSLCTPHHDHSNQSEEEACTSFLFSDNSSETAGLLFSEAHQRHMLGMLQSTEIGATPHANTLPHSGPVDAVVSVSYSHHDAQRFWGHCGNGQHRRHRDDSLASLPDDEYPEPVWMKMGEEPPDEEDPAESEQSGHDSPSYKNVPGPCDPEDLLDGVIFGAKYLGSTQIKSARNPSTNARMAQAQEAVDRIKAPEGESQPMTEVDLFISTQRIKVLTADTQEAMMDHALQMISYIADIDDIVVLMARRKRKGQDGDAASATSQKKCIMICHVFSSEDAQVIAQAIGQAFGVAYQQFLQANGIKASDLRPGEYSDYLENQELYNGDLAHFSDSQNLRDIAITKASGEILGLAVVESGWGSILPTVVVANLLHGGPAERCGELSIGDRIMSINGTSLVGLPITACQNIIRDLKNQKYVKLSIVHCPPVTMAIIKRPDPKFQLGFSVEDGIICSLMRGGIAERGGIRVGHRIIEINGQSVVATPHDKIIQILTNAIGEIHLKTMPASTYRLLTGQEQPVFL